MSGWNFDLAGVSRAGGRTVRERCAPRRLVAVILPFLLLSADLSGQESAPNCTPLIEAVDKVRRVDELDGTWLQATRQAVDPSLVELVSTFARMRRYELAFHRVDSYEAATAFRRVLRRNSRLACAHYGLGRTLARGPDALIRLGDGPRDHGPVPYSLAAMQAPRELRRALELDSSLAAAAAELFRMAADLRHPPIAIAARALPSLVAPSLRSDPLLLLYMAELEAVEGNPDSAASVIQRSSTTDWTPAQQEQAADVLLAAGRPQAALTLLEPLIVGGGASGGGLYARARALLATPGREREGATAYLRGLAQADPEMLERYVEDIEPLAGRPVRAWKAEGGDAVKDNMRWWWERSAALSGLELHERLAEHSRRLTVARMKYPLHSSLGATSENAVVLDPAWRRFRIDERGLVYVRQGAPARMFLESAGGSSSETWIYPSGTGGSDIYYFTRGSELDWAMVPLGCNVPRATREALAAWIPEIALSLTVCEIPRSPAAQEFQLRALQQALDAWATEGVRRHVADRPAFTADFYALRGGSGTALTAVIGIEGPGLEAGGLDADPVYGSRMDLILVDSRRRTVERADASQVIRPGRRLTASDAIRQYITAEVTPSETAEYRIVVTDQNNGSSRMAGGPIEIPGFPVGRLQLSDLVLASADSGTWRRGDVRLSLLPGRVFTVGDPLHVYFEIYDQPVDSTFAVEISFRAEPRRGLLGRIAGIFSGGGEAVTLRYDDTAAEADPLLGIQQLRTLGTADLAPGDYVLTVSITDRTTGTKVSRSRGVTLKGAEAPAGPERSPD